MAMARTTRDGTTAPTTTDRPTAHPALPRAARYWMGPVRPRAALIALISAAYGLVLALNIVTLLEPPRLSLVLSVPASGQARVAWLLPGSTLWDDGVRRGDLVLALDRRRPAPRDAGIWTGERLRIRTGAGATVAVDAGAIRSDRTTWPLLLLSPWFLLLGTLVLLRAPRPLVGQAIYALFATAAYALALAPAAVSDEPLASVAEFAMVCLFAACFVVFFLVFPTSRGAAGQRVALALPPLAAIVLYGAALAGLAPYDVAAHLRLAILLAYLLLGLGLLIYSFVTVRDRVVRRGLTIISAGTVASVLPFVALYVAPTLLHRPVLLAAEQAILALALLPASLTYAILRHHALDVHLLQRWLVHGLLGGALVALYTAVISARRWWLGSLPEPARGLVLVAVLVVLALLLFRWLYDDARRGLDRLIFKDHYDYRAALHDVSRDLTAMGDLDTVGAALPRSIQRLLNLDFAVLLVQGQQRATVCGTAGADDPALLTALTEAAPGVQSGPRIVPLAYGYLKVVLIPLHTHDGLAGHLCLGPKTSGEPFGADDQALLATLSGHLAAIVRNIQLVTALRATIGDLRTHRQTVELLNARLQRIQEEERARLAADLHDEPLQTALDIQRHLAATHNQPVATAVHSARLQTLIDQLRALCIRMRPAALDLLAMDLSERGGVLIQLSPSTELGGATLSPAAELVLYRATQEALTNSMRHGQAHEIMITLRRHGEMVQLCVADDGLGFAVPGHLDDLAQRGHLGLAGLRHRVQHSGGHLSVSSASGQGTIVQVDLPLERVCV